MNDLEEKYKYEFKLNSLFEITQKINENVEEDEIYNLFCEKLEALISLERMALFVFEEKWELKIKFGFEDDIKNITPKILKLKELTFLDEETYHDWPFNVIIPIFHNGKKLAVVCLAYFNESDDEEHLPFIKAVSNMTFVALEHNRMLRREIQQIELENELTIAGEVQSMLVPKTLPNTKTLEVNSTYIPHKLIGGDYYDCIQKSDTEYLFCIADVSGKGIPAALLMSSFQATLKALVYEGLELEEIVEKLNTSIFEVTGGERFITAFFAIYNSIKKELKYVNSGHNPPFFMDKDKKIMERLTEGSTMLGAFDQLPFINVGEIKLYDYTLLFLYTDGLVEIFDEYGAEFGEIGLEHFLKTEKTSTLPDMHEKLLDLILSYSISGYQDDITILSCKFRFN